MEKINLCIVLFACLAACSASDEPAASLPLLVSAEIGSGTTRADDVHATDYDKKNFATGDEIAIANSGGASVNYRRTAAGAWTPSVPTSPMTTTGANETFVATYPSGFAAIRSDQTTPTAFWASNCLRATARATANTVRFAFAPVACKLTLIVDYAAAHTDGTASVTGKGLHSGNSATSETISLLTTSEVPYGTGSRHTFTCIFSPAAATSYTISVNSKVDTTNDAGSYVENGTGLTFTPGYEYQYIFTSSSRLILTNVIIKEFQPGFTDAGGNETEEDAGNAT